MAQVEIECGVAFWRSPLIYLIDIKSRHFGAEQIGFRINLESNLYCLKPFLKFHLLGILLQRPGWSRKAVALDVPDDLKILETSSSRHYSKSINGEFYLHIDFLPGTILRFIHNV